MPRSFAVLAVILGLSSISGATAGETLKSGIAGVYDCQGTNPDGSPYKGIVEVVPVGDTFLVRWTLPDDVSVTGVGVFSSGVLAVSYFTVAPAVVVYKLDGERLVGEWTTGAEGAVHAETLTKMAKDTPRVVPRVPARDREPRGPTRTL